MNRNKNVWRNIYFRHTVNLPQEKTGLDNAQ